MTAIAFPEPDAARPLRAGPGDPGGPGHAPPPAPGLPPIPGPVPTVPPPIPVIDPQPDEPPVTDPGHAPPVVDPPPGAVPLSRAHARRLREVYRSAGWPCGDTLEVDLLAAGLLERLRSAQGHETVRVTDSGIAHIATALARHRAALGAHEALVDEVARQMVRDGRIAWRGLALRAMLPPLPSPQPHAPAKARWCVARPDVFSIRNTSVEAYAHPVVHEVKVSRADLLADLRKPDKRAAYADLGGEIWYVLGVDARGRPIGGPEDVPEGFGVMVLDGDRLAVARAALHRPVQRLPFQVWMALAKAQPMPGFDEDAQGVLGMPPCAAWSGPPG